LIVLPAKAGIQHFRQLQIPWTPAFAGVTTFYEFANLGVFVESHPNRRFRKGQYQGARIAWRWERLPAAIIEAGGLSHKDKYDAAAAR
jgi:hypothetical protein